MHRHGDRLSADPALPGSAPPPRGSGDRAREAGRRAGAGDRLTIVGARALPEGWTGKLWAVAEGLRHVEESGSTAELVLLTDADIAHHEDNLAELVGRISAERLACAL